MSDEEEQPPCECEEGLPAWMATFADMMALLMCFFVLLLSFAEMDAIRFKKMAESMKDAFGVQKEIPTNEIVKGISVIALEFSPSISDPAITETVRQETTEEEKQHLEVNDGPEKAGEAQAASLDAVEALLKADAQEQAEELKEALKEEIDEGMVTVEVVGTNVIIRINEKGSFPSGSADLQPGFIDVLDRIAVAISTRPGKVVVAGHTDNRPISTERFRSNWELSTARAVTVAHALLADPTLDPKRFLLEGHADSDPLVPNDTPENRALNRRVELIIKREKNEILEEQAAARPEGAAESEIAPGDPVPAEPAIAPVIPPVMEPAVEPVPSGVPEPVIDPMIEDPPLVVEPEEMIVPPFEMGPDDVIPLVPEDDIQQDDVVINVEDLI